MSLVMKEKNEYSLRPGFLSQNFSLGAFGLGVDRSVSSSKLNLPPVENKESKIILNWMSLMMKEKMNTLCDLDF